MAREASLQPLSVIEDLTTGNRFVVYTNRDGVSLELRFDGEMPWFTQADMVAMYGVSVQAVNQHIQNFAADGELDESTFKDFLIVRTEGNREIKRPITHYGLDVAFYVGYRVNSAEGKLFRRWATSMLVQLATKGFVIDARKLKGDPDRLAELRRIIQDIRADEANIYAELRRIVSMCKNYDPASEACRKFFALFQNRLLYAITGRTAAEIVVARADARQPNMGLKTWKGDHPLQEDAATAKNYLGPLELEDLNRLVSMVLDFFEDQTKRGWLVSMEDADAKLGEILAVNRRLMLPDLGKVTHSKADKHAKAHYKLFDAQRREERKRSALAELNEQAKKLQTKPKREKKS